MNAGPSEECEGMFQNYCCAPVRATEWRGGAATQVAERVARPPPLRQSTPRSPREQVGSRLAATRRTIRESMMKGHVLFLALVVAVICTADAERVRRRHRRLRTTTVAPPRGEPEAEHIELGMAERLDEIRYQKHELSRGDAPPGGEGGENELFLEDPCLKVHCSAGRVCEIDEHGDAVCNCIKECPYETESRRKVCTNQNETWASDCEVYRQRCLCLDGSAQCRAAAHLHVQVEYYGACRAVPACSAAERADFPRRMRDWLFNVMRDMAERRDLSPHYQRMEREAEANLTRRWTNAAIWKWCDLDAHDNDRFVSRHELFPIRAPLMALEHCIAPFLDSCDEDDDHRITLAEWGKCLQLDEAELEDRCDEFTDDSSASE